MELNLNKVFLEALNAQRRGDLNEAEKLYKVILDSIPDHPDANHNLGILNLSKSKNNIALKFFRNSIKSNPKKEQFWISLILCLIDNNDYELAKKNLKEGQREILSKKNYDNLFKKLELSIKNDDKKSDFKDKKPSNKILSELSTHLKNKDYIKAEKLAILITKEYSYHYSGWLALGDIYTINNKLFDALSFYKKSLELNINDYEINYKVALTLHNIGEFRQALKYYNHVIRLKNNFCEAHNNIGNIFSHIKKVKEAEASYKNAIKVNKNYYNAHFNLAILLEKQNRHKEAINRYKLTIKINPNFINAYINLSILLTNLNNLDEAEEVCKKGLKIQPLNDNLNLNLGNIFYGKYQFQAASELYKKVIKINPFDSLAFNNLGNTLRELNLSKEAIKNYKAAIKLNPKNSNFYNNLSVALIESGKLDEAKENLNLAIDMTPEFSEALMARGQLFFNEGKFKYALNDFDKCRNNESRARSLWCLYALGEKREIYKRIDLYSNEDKENLMVASFSSFFSEIEKKDNANIFCKNPLDFLYFSNLSSHKKSRSNFANDLIDELKKIENIWEPIGKSTKNGFQSNVNYNLFDSKQKDLKLLKSIILDELNFYYKKFSNKDCLFIEKWPKIKNIKAWYVILQSQGFQKVHIHPGGWLSGVIYLDVVPSLQKNEGAIEFSLSGEYFKNAKSSKLIYQPKIGDIIFFPSTLHHRTIPFTTNNERIIISFDLMPS